MKQSQIEYIFELILAVALLLLLSIFFAYRWFCELETFNSDGTPVKRAMEEERDDR